MNKGLLLVISGPSGVGKGTVLSRLLEVKTNFALAVSTTTRAPRAGEKQGLAYDFVDPLSFEEKIKEDAFLEWARVHNHYYGTPFKEVNEAVAKGADLVLEIDVQGAVQVREKMPEAVLIFLAPPSMAALETRLKGRGTEDDEKIKGRLVTAGRELQAYHLYDYLVVNDRVEEAALTICAIAEAEKCRISRGLKPPSLKE